MLSPSKIAEKLGVTRQTVHNWIKSKKLPALRIGGVWRVWPEDLDEFIKSQNQPDPPPKP